MTTLTQQEVFSRVWDHFIVKDAPRGLSVEGCCRYRGAGDSRCAVGLFMTDDEANGAEGLLALELVRQGRCGALAGQMPDFIAQLQSAHDVAWDKADFELRLRGVAKTFNLKVPA